eukprot:CAMPEP_0204344306 /NCGR_PEP_ID=MMETSP0469-20131031/25533_1 /ASSEMBLY_ACC=CAM_ASM_000384 /TAXON_ID=2969 /ORGANISM="Oxyrrhis marina" /LENGTH=49 /DNA_ID=CAMNT_0051329551 /DNA_START=146 /DNA_END=295 /DNA_ORIENTATION=+
MPSLFLVSGVFPGDGLKVLRSGTAPSQKVLTPSCALLSLAILRKLGDEK